ncbi:virion protein [Cercopithecine alphaherpesvirus 9]|uniref:Virion protein n=1 Tax=Cercopithecine herpesvirus 9 (strain DHV) TaxID=36348 RepID=Q9E1Y3_CHV9D|nr:DNA packaging tegument protein UL25 [Cercopithecine alphaherpesvirus 9]AAG27208.1 virion protein [Cercopithecine alphaherpesvirus 9]
MAKIYAFESISLPYGCEIVLPHSNNFIAPNFIPSYWTEPIFTERQRSENGFDIDVMVNRNAAVSAALDNFRTEACKIPSEIERRLKPLENQIKEMAKTLDELETAAVEAEEADADIMCNDTGSFKEHTLHKEVQVVKNDAPLQYDTNFQIDFLTLVYVERSRGNSMPSVVFGPWYRTIQERLIIERPIAARSIDYRDARISQTFMNTAITALQSCGKMYVGERLYSAFECAVLCLYLVHRELSVITPHTPVTFKHLINQLPDYVETLSSHSNLRNARSYHFSYEKLPKDHFHAPSGGKYEFGALLPHVILTTLTDLQILPPAPGQFPHGKITSIVDKDKNVYVDKVQRAAATFLQRAQNIFLMEDQSLLRLTINTITTLLLLKRLLWNGNVYGDKFKNNFQLGLLVMGAADKAKEDLLLRGATGNDSKIKSDNNNFRFLCENYILPLYVANPTTEITEMFPGVAALCLDAFGQLHHGTLGRVVIDISSGQYQDQLMRLIALELENRRKPATSVPVTSVILAHDSVMLQYERGLGLLMQQTRLRMILEESRRLAQFSVNSDYDLLYFVCLGFIPQFTSVA